jgi:hypothetical protein
LVAGLVDVFIATYNEPVSVLERTIIGALAIDHPDLRVFVLDDGARDFVRDLAHELGAHYVFRVKGKHAKAGNVNNDLKHALSSGRRPAFILLLNADFVPGVNILKRTLGLFAERDVGIVQTPQHFFEPDPSGARISDPLPAGAKEGEEGVLLLDDGARQVPFRFVWLDATQSKGQGFGIVFEAGIPLRRALTARLFTGAYRHVIDEIVIPRVLYVIGKRLLR